VCFDASPKKKVEPRDKEFLFLVPFFHVRVHPETKTKYGTNSRGDTQICVRGRAAGCLSMWAHAHTHTRTSTRAHNQTHPYTYKKKRQVQHTGPPHLMHCTYFFSSSLPARRTYVLHVGSVTILTRLEVLSHAALLHYRLLICCCLQQLRDFFRHSNVQAGKRESRVHSSCMVHRRHRR
jgi:hypothetical protein